MSTLRIRLFGSLDLEREGQPLAPFPSRKARDLFAFLAVRRQNPHPREHLAGMFWGDSADDRARHALNTTLWRINRVLEEDGGRTHGYLRVSPQHIGFNATGDMWLDVHEFETRCALAEQTSSIPQRIALLRQAVSFYRGELLMDCYDDWCLIERERLQCLYLRALARLLEYHSAQGEADEAIDCARRILGCDPLREEVHRDLIRLLLEAGQPAAALRQYRACEELLREELAVGPAPETRGVLAEILAQGQTPLPIGSPPRREAQPALDVEHAAHQLERLSSMCASLRDQLAETATLLEHLTAQLEATGSPAPPRLRSLAG